MKKLLALILALVMVLSFAACSESENPGESGKQDSKELTVENIKIGFIHVTDPADKGYVYNHDLGTWKMAENLGISKDQIINKYNIAENEGTATAIEELVEAGCDIIFATSFGHGDYMTEAAAKHPDIEFCHATGSQAANSGLSNYHNYFTSIYEARYIAGVAAGLKLNELIENGTITEDQAVIGYVSAFYFPEVISGFTAFYLGARSVCPSATMITLKADSWTDPVKEGQIAQSLIDQGAVIISQHSDNTTPATVAEAAGVFHCGYNSDMAEAAPKASIISARSDWSVYLTYAISCVLNGEPIATDWCKGYAEGAVFTSPLNEAIAAPGTAEKIEEVAQGLKDGSIHVFQGPWQGYNIFDSNDTSSCAAEAWVEESVTQSAPYFSYIIDGITLLDA